MADHVETYSVTLTRPDGMTVNDMKRHIREAIEMWSVQQGPSALEWPIGALHSITVKRITSK